ncbi:hypothetical protein BGX24_007551 [Mortierella sp. AD032]|nr:hypothetical protein BGX24_007551 [Mortierella sp. AD032]
MCKRGRIYYTEHVPTRVEGFQNEGVEGLQLPLPLELSDKVFTINAEIVHPTDDDMATIIFRVENHIPYVVFLEIKFNRDFVLSRTLEAAGEAAWVFEHTEPILPTVARELIQGGQTWQESSTKVDIVDGHGAKFKLRWTSNEYWKEQKDMCGGHV